MGCEKSKPIIYSKKDLQNDEKNDRKGTENYINPHIDSFIKIEEEFSKKTFIGEILKNFNNYSSRECLGYRRPINEKSCENNFTYFTYSQIKSFSINFSKNLIKNNFCQRIQFPEEQDSFLFLGLFAKNCIEWIVTDIACQLNSITSVTFYATLGDVAFDYISKQTSLTTICISNENVETFINYIKKFNIENIKNVILFDYTLYFNEENKQKLINEGFHVIKFSEMIKKTVDNEAGIYDKNDNFDTIKKITNDNKNVNNGNNRLMSEFELNDLKNQNNQIENSSDLNDLNLSKPNTILTICYTSGTTGVPKGVKLCQSNFIAQMENMKDSGLSVMKNDTFLIYLPLAHIMERIEVSIVLSNGCRAGLLSGDPRTSLTEDIEILKPTVLMTVPRVLQLFRQKILDTLQKIPEESFKKKLINKAIASKRETYLKSHQVKSFLKDKIVFSKIRQKFGGNIRAFICGSAPLSNEIAADIKIFFSIPIVEGYGLTEVCGAATVSNFNDFTNDSAGGPIKTCMIKLEDVTEMNYHSKTELNGMQSPTGEICIKGSILFKGYFRNEKATKESIDDEGWFHTGDIGRLLPVNNGLKIIDRRKEIFKLSQGEYIAPGKLESAYGKSKFVLSIFVYGNSYKSYLIAVIVPNKENVLEFLKTIGEIEKNVKNFDEVIGANNSDNEQNKSSTLKKLFENKLLINAIKEDLDNIAKGNGFNSLEKIAKLILTEKEFLISNGCLTPTLKLVRNVVAKMFEKEINEIYE